MNKSHMPNPVFCLDNNLFDELEQQAHLSPRRRAHLDIHASHDEPVQRFLNVMTRGSYVQPHQHANPPKWEMIVSLRGTAAILIFDDHGKVLHRHELDAQGPGHGVELPEHTWHTVVATCDCVVLLELKQGPFIGSQREKDFAPWAPAEGETGQDAFEAWCRTATVGDCFTAA